MTHKGLKMLPGAVMRACCQGALIAALSWVSAFAESSPSYRNEVMAVLSQAGCNAGACHGNANGKASFKLSLRGEDPDTDYLALTRDQFARRIDLLAPDESLLLLKGTAAIAHEGGQRFSKESAEYSVLKRWIAAGAPNDTASAPSVVELTVNPTQQVLIEPKLNVQITATARFSDGSQKDVTSSAVYEPDKPSVKVTPAGLVQAPGPGEVTVIVRFLEQQRPVRLAFVPDRDFQWSGPKPNNFIDKHIFAKLKTLRTNPSEEASDELFMRRAYLDLLGILPTREEAQAFVANRNKQKRAKLVETLLERPEFADFWALKWADLLRIEERLLDAKGVHAFHRWIRQSIAENKPLDQFAREIVAAHGSTYENPAANFYRAIRTPAARAEATAQVFMGVRLQCAQCHNHPFDRWSQDDYYDWGSIFARVDYKVLENRRRDDNDKHEFKGEQVVFVKPTADYKNARTGGQAVARFLGEKQSKTPLKKSDGSDKDLLDELGEWITAPANPFFAKTQVNRVWYNLMGRGLVEPIDDFRPTNPASHPELLEELTSSFVENGFDLRWLITTIMTSRTYQLDSKPNETNAGDETNFSHAYLRRLSAEQLLDCQAQVAGAALKLPGLPEGYRAAQSPGALAETRGRNKRSDVDQALAAFGKPARLLTCECERSSETTMSQAFQMISGPVISDLLNRSNNRLDQLANSGRADAEIIGELYWTALTRSPTATELAITTEALRSAADKREALEDIAWSLMNAKEFVFRR